MPAVLDRIDNSLVPAQRFGALLSARRTQQGLHLSALARASAGQFLPDQLADAERGDARLSDEEIEALASLYSIRPRPWSTGAPVELLLDRTSISIASDQRLEHFAPEDLLIRYLGLTLVSGIGLGRSVEDLSPLAEALGQGMSQTSDSLREIVATASAKLVATADRLAQRVIVPNAGILVGYCPAGSLVLTRSSAGADLLPAGAATGSLESFIHAA